MVTDDGGVADGRQREAAAHLRQGKRVQIQIGAAAAEAVIARAAREKRTVSQMLRLIIEEWSDREGRPGEG